MSGALQREAFVRATASRMTIEALTGAFLKEIGRCFRNRPATTDTSLEILHSLAIATAMVLRSTGPHGQSAKQFFDLALEQSISGAGDGTLTAPVPPASIA